MSRSLAGTNTDADANTGAGANTDADANTGAHAGVGANAGVSADAGTDHIGGRLAGAAPIGLAELDASSALQQRFDNKYLIDLGQFDAIADRLAATHRRLVIDGRDVFDYRSSYLDTPELACYHGHRQGRRLRFKARTRLYDTGLCRFEVKLKDGRGLTDKHAITIKSSEFGTLPRRAATFLTSVLDRCHGTAAPAGLAPRLLVRNNRHTLAARSEQCRVTVDSDLHFIAPDGTAALRDGLLLVETKSPRGRGLADDLLRRVGAHPINVSKYCAGMALIDPELPEQPWRRLLQTHFTGPHLLASR